MLTAKEAAFLSDNSICTPTIQEAIEYAIAKGQYATDSIILSWLEVMELRKIGYMVAYQFHDYISNGFVYKIYWEHKSDKGIEIEIKD